MQSLWVSMPILRNIVVSAARNPQVLERLCAVGGLTTLDLENSNIKLSLEQNCALMEGALQVSGDPHLGLHIGERTTVSVLGITPYGKQPGSVNRVAVLTAIHDFFHGHFPIRHPGRRGAGHLHLRTRIRVE